MEYSKDLHDQYAKAIRQKAAGTIYIGVGELEAILSEITRLQSEARWIPVSERLPEVKKDTLFLCAFKDFQDKWKVDTRTFWVDSKYFSGSCKIEFYMPLPTPPTEG